jgi:hypothetical protein
MTIAARLPAYTQPGYTISRLPAYTPAEAVRLIVRGNLRSDTRHRCSERGKGNNAKRRLANSHL